MRLRRIALAIALIVFGVVPAAVALTADPFGPVEVADPTWHPGSFFNGGQRPFVGADGAGNVLLATAFRSGGNDQLAVYERCGAGPVTWQRTVLTSAAKGVESQSMRVARDGTAMVVWRVSEGGTQKHYSRTRPPGGAWEEPQEIVTDADVTSVQIALSDSGDAIAAWADSTPAGTWTSIRPAGGTWGTPELMSGSPASVNVAMSSGGDALVAYKHPRLGLVYARHKPAGGGWGSQVEVLSNNYQDTLRDLKTEFDGQGRAVVMARYRELNDAIRVNVRGAGSAGTWAHASAEWDETFLDDDGANPPNPSYDVRNLEALARHPEGVVAVWTRRNNETQVVVSRLRAAGWETPVAFAVPTSYYEPRVAVNDAGEILLAGTVDYSSVTEIRGMIVPSLTAPWPSPALLSPQASVANQYRDAFAVAGGSAFSVGWGVHGTGNQRTDVISTKAAGAACGAAPTPTATASASASPDPLPLPSPAPTATPAPSPPAAPAPPSAIADFTTLPAASKCVRGRKLTVKFKKPPKGYVVKTVTVKVNAKKVATVKGKKLKQPLYLRKLPKGTFTVTVSISLTKGKGLTEKRRYTACK